MRLPVKHWRFGKLSCIISFSVSECSFCVAYLQRCNILFLPICLFLSVKLENNRMRVFFGKLNLWYIVLHQREHLNIWPCFNVAFRTLGFPYSNTWRKDLWRCCTLACGPRTTFRFGQAQTSTYTFSDEFRICIMSFRMDFRTGVFVGSLWLFVKSVL